MKQFLLFLCLCISLNLSANVFKWSGGSSGYWNKASSWTVTQAYSGNADTIPTTRDSVIIDVGGSISIIVGKGGFGYSSVGLNVSDYDYYQALVNNVLVPGGSFCKSLTILNTTITLLDIFAPTQQTYINTYDAFAINISGGGLNCSGVKFGPTSSETYSTNLQNCTININKTSSPNGSSNFIVYGNATLSGISVNMDTTISNGANNIYLSAGGYSSGQQPTTLTATNCVFNGPFIYTNTYYSGTGQVNFSNSTFNLLGTNAGKSGSSNAWISWQIPDASLIINNVTINVPDVGIVGGQNTSMNFYPTNTGVNNGIFNATGLKINVLPASTGSILNFSSGVLLAIDSFNIKSETIQLPQRTLLSNNNINLGVVNLNGSIAQKFPNTTTDTAFIQNLVVNNSAGVTINLGYPIKVTSQLKLTNGTLTTNGKIILASTAAGSASVPAITTGAINGNVTVERYVGSSQQWRMIGFPFTAATTLAKNTFNTFYSVTPPTVYTYNESGDNGAYAGNGGVNAGWVQLANFTSTTANKGILISGGTIPSAINFTGAINTGTQAIALSYSSANTNKGWNLIANPYASNINWTTIKANAANTNNLDNAIYRYDPNTTGYASYVNGVSIGNQSNVIENGAGFFVHSTGATSLTITEGDKTTNAPAASLFGIQPIATDTKSIIKLSLLKEGETYGDEVAVRWGVDPATDNFDGAYDAYDLGRSNGADLSVVGKDGTVYSIFHGSALQTKDKEQRIIALSTKNLTEGNYSINTNLLSAMYDNNDVYLVDHYTHQTTLISSATASYPFMVTSDANSASVSRFSVALNYKATDNTNNTNLPVMLLNNPSTGKQFTLYSKNNYNQLQWQIVDATGRILQSGLLSTVVKGSTHQINAGNTSKGTYFIKLNGDGNALPVLKALKN